MALLVQGGIELTKSHAPGTEPEPAAVKWGPCAEGDPAQGAVLVGAQCGDLSVPLDHAKPAGARVTVALARLRATGDKIGSLVINPGGPGVSGVDFLVTAAAHVSAKLRELFDIVSFDPRGVGLSRPLVECNTDADDDRDRADPDVDHSPAGVAQTDTESREYVQRCVDKTGEEFLANVGTESVARDMDLLRAALGDDKLTYVGMSYGTFLGSRYAELFPERVRAMVLDGAVDPAVDPMQAILDQAETSQKAFDDYAAHCAKAPDCPLGTDPTKAVERFHALVDPLVDQPAQTDDPRGLSYNDALSGVYDLVYTPDHWEQLTAALAALRDRKPADDLLKLADDYNRRDADGHYDGFLDAFSAIGCADSKYPTDEAAWVEFDKKYREVSPFDSYGEFTGHAPRAACVFWPVRTDVAAQPVTAPGLPPTLVISATGDPATPYLDGVHLAEQMHATLLTVDGTKHGTVFQVPCVRDIVTAYLIDLTLPPPDKRCSIGP